MKTSTKLKAYAGSKINAIQKLKFSCEKFENIDGKGENAGFQKPSSYIGGKGEDAGFQKPSSQGLSYKNCAVKG